MHHLLYNVIFLTCLYKSTGRAIALPSVSAVALRKMLKFYVKDFKTLYVLNPQMNLLYIWYDNRCWSKILFSNSHTSAYDLEVKVTDLKICINKNVSFTSKVTDLEIYVEVFVSKFYDLFISKSWHGFTLYLA